MEKEETTRKWRRASIVIQCAMRGRLAKKRRDSMTYVDQADLEAHGVLLRNSALPERPEAPMPRPTPGDKPSFDRRRSQHRQSLHAIFNEIDTWQSGCVADVMWMTRRG